MIIYIYTIYKNNINIRNTSLFGIIILLKNIFKFGLINNKVLIKFSKIYIKLYLLKVDIKNKKKLTLFYHFYFIKRFIIIKLILYFNF